jgi:hypothetical protein
VSAIDRIREKVVDLKIDKETVAALPSIDIQSRS